MSTNDPKSKYYLGGYRKVTRYRILSLDGGGIYGLTEALLLKELCRRDKKFLTEDQPIAVFAGCSAGAVNALLLANHENPRDAIESGELEAFWEGFSGSFDPLNWWWSCLGVTAMNSASGILDYLARYFGDRTLGDLKQNVLISTFAWSGLDSLPGIERRWTTGEEAPPSSPLTRIWELWFPWLKGWLPPHPPPRPTGDLWDKYYCPRNPWVDYDDPNPLTLKASRGNLPEGCRTDSYRHWQPQLFQVFNNHPLGGDATFIKKRSKIPEQQLVPDDFKEERNVHAGARIVDVAYAAASPPGIQEIRYGLGDGASFTANPAPQAFVRLMQYLRWSVYNPDVVRELLPLVHGFRYGREDNKGDVPKWDVSDKHLANDQLALCAQSAISVLSVGDGSKMPYLWPPDNNLGSLPFYLGPTNLWKGDLFPPLLYMLQPGNEVADLEMRELLGWHYCRLNPAVMEMPTILACVASRVPLFNQWIIKTIRDQMRSRTTQEALDVTWRYFLKEPWFWRENRIPLAMPLGSCQHPDLLKEFPDLEDRLDKLLKKIRSDRMPDGSGDPFAFALDDPDYPFEPEGALDPETVVGRTQVEPKE